LDLLKKILSGINKFFDVRVKKHKALYIVLAVIAVTAIVCAAVLLNQKSYTVLYSGMDAQDAGEMLTVLQEMGVDAKAQGTGTILVDSASADEVRMELAAQGYPSSGLNYDIFSNAAGLGSTDMEKQVYYQFQLQENIRKTLLRMDKVEDAIVNINLAEDSAFVLADNQKPASAAVMLELASGEKLTDSEVGAIIELVSKSVSGLSTENVRIVDSQMNLYTAADDEDELSNTGSQLELQQIVQKNLQEQVVNLLTPVFGDGQVLAQVNVRLDFDRQSQESIEFSPPEGGTEGLVTSLTELEETIADYDGTSTGNSAVGVDSNGDTPTYPSVTDDGNDAAYKKVSREVTSQINQTKTLLETAQGKIEELSVAVILNSVGMTSDYTDKVADLVANAIGVSPDKITVELLPFSQSTAEDSSEFPSFNSGTDTDEENGMWKILFLVLAVVVLMMFVVIISLQARNARLRTEAYAAPTAGVANIDLVADEPLDAVDLTQHIKSDQKDAVLAQVEEYIDKSPEAVAMLLRSWLSDD
jgi:flagellar M-ring protein FliF